MKTDLHSTQRFSDRVENYIKYRPHYPQDVLSVLSKNIGLSPSSIIADVGAGTGISTKLLLSNGNTVYAVEPNAPMREAAESLLAEYKNYHSIDGTAEATTLADSSVDIVTAAQAFHWFDIEASRKEFERILKPNGWVVFMWNLRRLDSTPFLVAYETFLRKFGTDYPVVADDSLLDRVARFFSGVTYHQVDIENQQSFDFDGLKGRLLSSSYIPQTGPRIEEMLSELQVLFDTYKENGAVRFEYDTNIYYGQL
ncbi:MAG TPA: class I SAM-dependent methyltransferase [Candidatus Kapabacteria bacterium]|nr:class I SAM-dependent methyltransferase [Candidatus Kapabacteria bacterium]